MASDKHSLIPAVYILFEKDDKILMIRRFNTGYADGKYSLVAGHVEKGESFKDAAVRESFEEIGVKIQKHNLEFFHVMYRSTESGERVDIFFTVKTWEGDAINMEPAKCDELIWVESNKLPENSLDYVAFALQSKLKNISMSEWN